MASERRSVWELSDLVTPMAVRVVATLRVADQLAAGPRHAADVAQVVRADPDALERIMRHLTRAGVFSRDTAGRYGLTEVGESLRDDHPGGARAYLDLEGALGRAELSMVRLLRTVRTGQKAFEAHYGRPFWEDLAADAERTASFDALMAADVSGWAPLIVSAYDWGSLGHLVDVGGGNGALLMTLLAAYPDLRGTLLDQPRTAAAAAEALAAAGFDGRAEAVAGDFFDRIPAGADGYLLCAIIYDWDDDAGRTILSRCAEAAGSTGRVFVAEKTGAGGESVNTAMDLRMLAYFGGRERGVTDIVALADSAGLRAVAVHQADDLSVLEFAAR